MTEYERATGSAFTPDKSAAPSPYITGDVSELQHIQNRLDHITESVRGSLSRTELTLASALGLVIDPVSPSTEQVDGIIPQINVSLAEITVLAEKLESNVNRIRNLF